MTSTNRFTRPILLLLSVGMLIVIILPLVTWANQQTINLAAGDEITITCETLLDGVVEGNEARFTCAAPEPSPTPTPGGPTITSLNGVADGDRLSGTVAIEAIVRGDDIQQVTFNLTGPDATDVIHVERHYPYFLFGDRNGNPNGWNTTEYPDGDYTLTVTATDSRDQSNSYEVTFAVANASSPTPTPPTGSGEGICGESMTEWHPPMVNGCATGHEHGDAPPEWIAQAGYSVRFAGDFNTPRENELKHAAFKGFEARFSNVDIYFRVHAQANPMGRSARYHSYQVWARDPSGNVSHWQGWYDTGDPERDRIVRRRGGEPDRRPVMLVVDREAWDAGIRCEQWYAFTATWSWDFGWTICNTTTLFQPSENTSIYNENTWAIAPDDSRGTTRRLEAAWYADRQHPTGTFYTTQFGEIVSGLDDARCSGTTDKFGVTYDNICLEQYIAPTMTEVKFPGNAVQKQFDATGVELPN